MAQWALDCTLSATQFALFDGDRFCAFLHTSACFFQIQADLIWLSAFYAFQSPVQYF